MSLEELLSVECWERRALASKKILIGVYHCPEQAFDPSHRRPDGYAAATPTEILMAHGLTNSFLAMTTRERKRKD